MKYFKKDWFDTNEHAKKTINEYEEYYSSIENQLSESVKQVLNNRHDTYIVKSYFEDKNYVMELDEEIWGKARLVFQNADVKLNGKIEDEWWLYDEIYKVGDKIEIHILFDKADIIILCGNAYINIKDKNYFNDFYKNEDFDIYNEIYNEKNGILNAIIDKEIICGRNMLKDWEHLIFSFSQIYEHFMFYRYRNIDSMLEIQYYNYSEKEKQEIYIQLFSNLEKDIFNSIQILQKYENVIEDKDLKSIIFNLLEIYNKKDLQMHEKNQLYLKITYELQFDFNKIYKRILDCIYEGLIK